LSDSEAQPEADAFCWQVQIAIFSIEHMFKAGRL
jgi:hypothetical protein